jgi:hypothetical protein
VTRAAAHKIIIFDARNSAKPPPLRPCFQSGKRRKANGQKVFHSFHKVFHKTAENFLVDIKDVKDYFSADYHKNEPGP